MARVTIKAWVCLADGPLFAGRALSGRAAESQPSSWSSSLGYSRCPYLRQLTTARVVRTRARTQYSSIQHVPGNVNESTFEYHCRQRRRHRRRGRRGRRGRRRRHRRQKWASHFAPALPTSCALSLGSSTVASAINLSRRSDSTRPFVRASE